MKSTILLTIALFMISAPSPDSKTLTEVSAGFLVTPDRPGLMAAPAPASRNTKDLKTEQQVLSAHEVEPKIRPQTRS